MRTRLLLAAATALLAVSTACNRHGKAEQLAALENIYQAGLLTRDEYDAKKLAIAGPPPAPPTPVAATQPPAPVASVPPQPEPPAFQKPSALAPPPARPSTRVDTPPPVPSAAEPPLTTPPPVTAEVKTAEPAPAPGCEDAEFKSGGPKGQQERFFAASPDAVKRAAISALDSLDFNIKKNGGSEIEASKRRHVSAIVGAGGERVLLHFEKSERGGQSGTRVTGETKKSLFGRLAQKTWTDAVLAQMACKLRAGN